jgi:AmmeMemoRadiSam system protein A
MCPQSESPSTSLRANNEFSPTERSLLIELAHQSILSRLEGVKISSSMPTAHLAEPRGVFTTVCVAGNLRGCVGSVYPTNSLYESVIETARSAAFDDPRFPPITREEVANIEILLSVLSPLFPIDPQEIAVGRHGLLIAYDEFRGLLLPQVATEHGWNRITFLEHTCRKAGLPPDAWQTGATVAAFTAEVFGDRDARKMGEASPSPNVTS